MVRDHKNRLICRIDTWGLLAVFITLITLFMCLPMAPICKCVSVDLAKVGHSKSLPRALREDALNIEVQRDGKVFFHEYATLPEALPGRIRAAVKEGADARVYIRADARAKYGAVREVIDAIHDARIDRVSFIVEQR